MEKSFFAKPTWQGTSSESAAKVSNPVFSQQSRLSRFDQGG
jgi:hypothetical protein